MENNKTLKSLHIINNKIGPFGVKMLADVLNNNTTLTSLDISRNYIFFEGAERLAEALKNNDPELFNLRLESSSSSRKISKTSIQNLKLYLLSD